MSSALSTTQVARLLGVSDQSVANWIDQEKLPAGRTPGGHRRIQKDDLVAFIKQQKLRLPPELAPATMTILIVDDDAGVCKWLSRFLKSKYPNSHVMAAQDGYSAGEMVTAERPDVVILDLYMPGLDGFEVCRRIKSKPVTRDVAVVGITGHYTPEIAKGICAAGAAACLAKPIDAKALHLLLETLLPQKK